MATSASSRGWGPGWPNCQTGSIKTLRRSDGVVLPVREELALLIAGLCDETERRGYNLVPGWCWGFACRAIRGKKSPSNHSWGLAVDLNAPKNPMTDHLVTDMPPWVPALWKAYGFGWGGDYDSRPDAMHMEYLGTPQTAVAHTRKLYESLLPPHYEEDALPITDADVERIAMRTKALVTDVLRAPEFNIANVINAVNKDRRLDREELVQTFIDNGMSEAAARELATKVEGV